MPEPVPGRDLRSTARRPRGRPDGVVGGVENWGGRDVWVVRHPGDDPAVVLLGGCGVPYYLWDEVVSRLPGVSVVRMDRPGMTSTAWPRKLPTLADEVTTLADLACSFGAPPVVVAHSMAALHAEALVRRHPGRVSGMVLVDGSYEREPKKPTAGGLWLAGSRATYRAAHLAPIAWIGAMVNRIGVAALSHHTFVQTGSTMGARVFGNPDTLACVVAEQAAYRGQIIELSVIRSQAKFPQLPTVLLTAAQGGRRSWVRQQAELAELLHARQVVVGDAGHLMMIDRPDVVASHIRSVRTQRGTR